MIPKLKFEPSWSKHFFEEKNILSPKFKFLSHKISEEILAASLNFKILEEEKFVKTFWFPGLKISSSSKQESM